MEYEIRGQGLREVVVESLRTRTLGWEYPPGHSLTEEQLCKEYGVSRSPVREALHRLEAGAIENQILLNDMRSINDRISIFRVLDFEIDQRTEGMCKQHLAILNRISKGDVEEARRAMRVNVEDGCNNVEGNIKKALVKAHGMNARRLQ